MNKSSLVILLFVVLVSIILFYNYESVNSESVKLATLQDTPFLPPIQPGYGDHHQRDCIMEYRDCRGTARTQYYECMDNAGEWFENCGPGGIWTSPGVRNFCSILLDGWEDACETQYQTGRAGCITDLQNCLSENDGFGETVPEGFECLHGVTYVFLDPNTVTIPRELKMACLNAGGLICPVPKGMLGSSCNGGGMELCFEGNVIQCCFRCRYGSSDGSVIPYQ